jgi:hypothetical protein
MTDCEHCDKDFSSKREKLEHELDEHGEEMSSHDKSEKKTELNKLKQQKQTSKHKRKKQIQYGVISIMFIGLVAGGGFYASQNMDSFNRETNASMGVGEPIHWHANYQISVCGEDQVLEGGPMEAHTHGEKTFHMEGVRTSEEQAKLDWIVDSLGGELEENSIMGREECNGEPANLTVEANGDKVEDHLNYVPRDGDMIRITYE